MFVVTTGPAAGDRNAKGQAGFLEGSWHHGDEKLPWPLHPSWDPQAPPVLDVLEHSSSPANPHIPQDHDKEQLPEAP